MVEKVKAVKKTPDAAPVTLKFFKAHSLRSLEQ